MNFSIAIMSLPYRTKYDKTFSLGQLIGKWTVTDPTPVKILYKEDSKYGPAGIRVKCECGTVAIIEAQRLVKEASTSCGCVYRGLDKNPNWKGYGAVPGRYVKMIERGAERRNLEFSLTTEYLSDLYEKQNRQCALSGEPLTFSEARKSTTEWNASLDRINSDEGYVDGNVQWVSRKVNFAKLDMPQNDFINMCIMVADKNAKKDS